MDGKQRGPSTESLLSLGLDIVKIDVARLLFNEKSFRIMKLPNQVSLRKGQLNQYVCERVS